MLRIFGGLECRDSRRALKWLKYRGLPHQFYDMHTGCIDLPALGAWIDAFGWQALIDRRTVAWRGQPVALKRSLSDDEVRRLIVLAPRMVKSPIIGAGDRWLLGWNAANKVRLLGYMPALQPGHAEKAL